NIAMITTAFMTSPGLVDKDYYEKGRDYEENFIKERAARNALGWSFKLDLPEQLVVGQKAAVRFNVVDKLGVALNDLNIELVAYRPSDVNADFNTMMTSFAPGQYQADITFRLKGIWELRIKATQADKSYELIEQRVNIQPL
ncbi:MAG: FixH family protein, partial [Gammaproteobacteria bacterium]|nr:FixH family protein [Gammaproteobacteria bacterium]